MLEIKIEKTREYGRQKVQTPIDRRKMLLATSRITVCKTRVPKPISHYQDIFFQLVSQKSTITRIPLLSFWSSQSLDTSHSLLLFFFFYFVEWKWEIRYNRISIPSILLWRIRSNLNIQGSLLIFTSNARMKFNSKLDQIIMIFLQFINLTIETKSIQFHNKNRIINFFFKLLESLSYQLLMMETLL